MKSFTQNLTFFCVICYTIAVFFPIGHLTGVKRSYLIISSILLITCLTFLRRMQQGVPVQLDLVGQLGLVFWFVNTVGLLFSVCVITPNEFTTLIHVYMNFSFGIILYILAFNLIVSDKYLHAFVTVLAVTSFFVSLYFAYEYSFVKDAFFSTFAQRWPEWNSNFYQSALLELKERKEGWLFWGWLGGTNGRAVILLMFVSVLLGFVELKNLSGTEKILLPIIFIAIFAMYLQASASKLVFLFIVIWWWLYQQKKKNGNKQRSRQVYWVITLIFIVTILSLFFTPLKTKIYYLITGQGSLGIRFGLLAVYLDNIAHHAFLGNGFHTIYLKSGTVAQLHPHNVFIETMSDSGLFGLGVLILMFFFSWLNAEKLVRCSDSSLQNIGLGMQLLIISSILCFGVSNYLLKSTVFQVVFWTFIAGANRLSFESLDRSEKNDT